MCVQGILSPLTTLPFPPQIFKSHPLKRQYDPVDPDDPAIAQPNTALLSLVLMAGTFFMAFFLRQFKNSSFLPGRVRTGEGTVPPPQSSPLELGDSAGAKRGLGGGSFLEGAG